ncbi:MAG: putative molybdenum carrier protein [Candidatus Binatia bacterium]|nr:putative molybdenum carrier protein [Candidatus Binatia bacterium]
MRVRKIVSGGQTGVDRAALDVARDLGIERGGWCPKGRLAEDGRIPDEYPVRETDSAAYAERTEKNVIDSDGTLVLSVGVPQGGTAYTIECAQRHGKPYHVVDLARSPDPGATRHWLERHAIAVLNVAGPRASESPQGYALAYHFLTGLLREQGT